MFCRNNAVHTKRFGEYRSSKTICCTPDSSQNVLRFRKLLKASAWRKVTSRLSTGNSSDVSDDDDDDLRGLLQLIEKGSRLNIPTVCTAAAVYECYYYLFTII